MGDTFHSVWLEVAMLGVATTVVSNRLFAWAQTPERCAPTLARATRAAVLHGTCDASSSGWARVVRAELGEPSARATSEGAYRDAPARQASEMASRVFEAERSRIRRFSAIGLAGAAAAVLGAAALMRAQPVGMGLVALVAVLVAWRSLKNARAAGAALDSAFRAAPMFGVELRRAPAHAPSATDMPWMRVSAPAAMGFVLLGIASIVLVAVAFGATERVSARDIGMLLFAHVFFLPFMLAVVVLLRSSAVGVDGVRREVRVVRRILGIPYAHTTVPLEIVTGFSVDEKRESRGRTAYLVAKTIEGPVELANGDGAAKAAAALTSRLRAP